MPPSLLFSSIIAVLLLALLVAWLLPVQTTLDVNAVKKSMQAYFPDKIIADIYLSTDKKAGLTRFKSTDKLGGESAEELVIIRKFGSGVVIRSLQDKTQARSALCITNQTILVDLNDFTCPAFSMAMDKDAVSSIKGWISFEQEPGHAH